MNRREFLQIMTCAAASATLPRISLAASEKDKGALPNILWISVEDISPDLGCYGDGYAVTPNLDRFAEQGVRYTRVFSHSGVCAPTRSGIITGMYPTTIGTHHMRCQGVPPPDVRCFTEYLRAAGYYCTNNVKTDYQFRSPVTAWHECSKKAHWRNRPEGQQFFSVINLTTTHESRIRQSAKSFERLRKNFKPNEIHDPDKAVVPPYYPNTPVTRRDWANYYDIITAMDKQVGSILKQLKADGLAEDTIVWFWSDHGRGLPRAKRWIYDSGLHVPLIIRVPEKFRKLAIPEKPDAAKPGTVSDDLIAFIDFAPTVLSLAGVKAPDYVQGQPFLGCQKAPPRKYTFAARDRMDEAYDIIRAVRDKRFKYIRNFMPHVTYGQAISYMDQMPTMKEMRRLNAEGKLVGPQKHYFLETKPVEELYDTANDPHEIHNLAENPKYKATLQKMRETLLQWMKETGDVGLIPEPEFDELKRPGGEWQKGAAPAFTVSSKGQSNNGVPITIACSTPGASIAYKTGSGNKSWWKLYAKPVRLENGEVLRAKACRLGFRDSDVVQFKPGQSVSASKQQPVQLSEDAPHWREKLDRTDLLNRLRSIKGLHGLGVEAMPNYLAALNDKHGSVRYWGVVGLHTVCKDAETVAGAKTEVAKMLSDSSPIVRIAAAHALCDWGEEKQALPVLVEALSHRSDTVRLNAAIALGRIGDKARPALTQLRSAMNDRYRYVQRVAQYTLKRLVRQEK